ncbi:MAG: hypothetical protein KDA42_06645 [Planctomycetales bacterium]|nr:hypothetical protein [Planctomycetales bacterium]
MFLKDTAPFSLPLAEKTAYLDAALSGLVEHHRRHCAAYARIAYDWRSSKGAHETTVNACPFLPVSLFKQYDLKSTDEETTVLNSSATTSSVASRIYADKATKKRQALSANKILADFVGQEKRDYIVFDLEETVRGGAGLGARAAAILSLAHMAREFHFVMREVGGQLVVDHDALGRAMESIGDRPFIAYGFTYILYQAHRELRQSGFDAGAAHPDSRFLHSGGWKKVLSLAVDKPTFNHEIASLWDLAPSAVIDFYGVIEQTGVPYPDCSAGFKHAPYWADVIIRKNDSLEIAEAGQTGLIQLLNCLPLSAPNHSVLTEDLGRIELDDGCSCGRRGKAFTFQGRAPRSETRGCSDVARY